MIDMKLIMQSQGVVAVTPIITDAAVFIDDQCINTKLGQAGCNRQSGLATTDN